MKDRYYKHITGTVECKWCGKPTRYTGTGECNGCWELRHRIEADLKLAIKMLRVLLKRRRDDKLQKAIDKRREYE